MIAYDAVVIGAGNAGLTAATTLQRGGMRTLLVERHNIPGGCATSFRRGRFEFEVALHPLSGIGSPDQAFTMRRMLEGLDVMDRLEFIEEPELYRAVVPGLLDVIIPADWAGAVAALTAAFPGNRERLERFFELVKTTTFWQIAARRGMPEEQIDEAYFGLALRPLREVLDEYFDDPGLKHTLAVYWTYLGQPPSVLSFQDFAMTLFAYFEFKPWHLRGGSQALSSALLDSFLESGGEVIFNTGVTRIRTEQGRVTGVVLDDGREISAPEVVSNAALPITYGMLDEVPAEVSADLATRRVGISAFVVHLGLDATAEALGFTTSTMFIDSGTDDDATFASWRTLDPARAACVTCYDVAPIGFSPPGACHVSLVTLQYADVWDTIAPEDYGRTKFAYADSLLDLLETTIPGVRAVIEEADVATPRTMAHYLGHPGGAIYGYDQDPTESWLFRNSERESHVPGLHLAGSWSGLAGFQPTLESGARVARRLLRPRPAA